MFQSTNRDTQEQFVYALVVGVCLLALLAGGCTFVSSRESLHGTYELKVGAGRIELSLLNDGTFSESIGFSSGAVEKRMGTWEWKKDGVVLKNLWIPKEFTPDYIRQADSSNQGVKYTELGMWSVRPEVRFGKVLIPMFPDADLAFVKQDPKK